MRSQDNIIKTLHRCEKTDGGGGKQKETARENRRKDKNKSLKQEIGNLGGQPLSMLITSPRNSY